MNTFDMYIAANAKIESLEYEVAELQAKLDADTILLVRKECEIAEQAKEVERLRAACEAASVYLPDLCDRLLFDPAVKQALRSVAQNLKNALGESK